MLGADLPPIDSPYWARRAAAWERIGPPWRPTPAVVEATARLAAPEGRVNTLLLGVTPELADRASGWGPLVAVDRSPAMIAALWRARGPEAMALRADWRALPLEDGWADRVLGDGVFAPLSPGELAGVALELARVCRPGGRVITRIYGRSRASLSLDEVLTRQLSGDWPSAEALRLALTAALHAWHPDGVPVARLWPTLCEGLADPVAQARALGWSPEALRPFLDGLDVADRLHFPDLDTLDGLLGPAFALEAMEPTDPEVPGCCALVAYRRR